MAKGFRTIKMKVGRNKLEEDVTKVKAMRVLELDSASYLLECEGLGRYEVRPISQHRMHDDREVASQSNPRLAHR